MHQHVFMWVVYLYVIHKVQEVRGMPYAGRKQFNCSVAYAIVSLNVYVYQDFLA